MRSVTAPRAAWILWTGLALGSGAALAAGPTTAQTYEQVQKPQLPAVLEKTAGGVVLGPDRVVRFPINVWGGWAPLIAANHGFEPNPQSLFAKYGFLVKLEVIEDASQLLTAYVAGQTPILWGTADMLVLFASELALGPRFQVFQQVDWSRGGDGIVVRRASVRTANDLRGKTIALAAFSPSHYYALTVLQASGIKPAEVKFFYTTTAFGAARAFYEREDIDAVVSFAPDIYSLTEGEPGKKFRLLTSTLDAQRLIADLWAVRTDFAAENPDIVEGLVRGIFEGMDLVRQDKQQVARWMYEGYRAFDIPSAEVCASMIGDAHLTGFGENLDFFLNEKNPVNFERTWADAARIWKDLGVLTAEIPASEIANVRILRTPSVAKRFASQQALPAEDPGPEVELDPEKAVLTMTVYFDAAQEKVDPNSAEVRRALEEIARLSGKFSGAAIIVAGYTDPIGAGLLGLQARKKANRQVPRILAAYGRRLEAFSAERAEFVRKALTERYDLRAGQFRVSARGGQSPVTTEHTERWRNRRVEVTVVPLGQ